MTPLHKITGKERRELKLTLAGLKYMQGRPWRFVDYNYAEVAKKITEIETMLQERI